MNWSLNDQTIAINLHHGCFGILLGASGLLQSRLLGARLAQLARAFD